MMEDYQNYLIAWGVYALVSLILYGLLWIGTMRLPWPSLRWYLRYVIAVVLLVPWEGQEPETYYAPAFIVGGFELMDSGVRTMLEIMGVVIFLILLGTLALLGKLAYNQLSKRSSKPAITRPPQE
ncbi:MAG: hypothetical protein JXQ97_13725 [Natronospirillum sp.]